MQALIGLSVGSVEAANSAGFIWMFPLTFVSSAFVDPSTMPDWLEPIADANPFTIVTNAARALYNGNPVGNDALYSILWSFGIIVVFAIAVDPQVQPLDGRLITCRCGERAHRRVPSRRMTDGSSRPWLVPAAQQREADIRRSTADLDLAGLDAFVHDRIDWNRRIYDDCVNLNPAGNVMNPRAEAVLSAGLSSHPSLGSRRRQVRDRPGSGGGDRGRRRRPRVPRVRRPPRRDPGRVGRAREPVRVHGDVPAGRHDHRPAGVDRRPRHPPPRRCRRAVRPERRRGADRPDGFTVDVERLAELAHEVRPALITLGGSLNPFPHPVAAVKEVAASVGAPLLFDAAHVCGLIAGGAWPNPLAQGADLMTMSTYKSLGGPAGGLVLTNHDDLAERIDAIAYPGLTANFDVSVTAALAIALLDWLQHGAAYAAAMIETSEVLAGHLRHLGLPVGPTASHQFVVDAAAWGDGDLASQHLRRANLLTSGIGLPGRTGAAGIRIGTPEVVRWGMTAEHMPELGDLVHRALAGDPGAVASAVTAFRHRFTDLHFIRR